MRLRFWRPDRRVLRCNVCGKPRDRWAYEVHPGSTVNGTRFTHHWFICLKCADDWPRVVDATRGRFRGSARFEAVEP